MTEQIEIWKVRFRILFTFRHYLHKNTMLQQIDKFDQLKNYVKLIILIFKQYKYKFDKINLTIHITLRFSEGQ